MLIGDHDDDDGGGGGAGSGARDGSDANSNATAHARTVERSISLSCLDEPLPAALQSFLMELDGAEPDLDALIGATIGEAGVELELPAELVNGWNA